MPFVPVPVPVPVPEPLPLVPVPAGAAGAVVGVTELFVVGSPLAGGAATGPASGPLLELLLG